MVSQPIRLRWSKKFGFSVAACSVPASTPHMQQNVFLPPTNLRYRKHMLMAPVNTQRREPYLLQRPKQRA